MKLIIVRDDISKFKANAITLPANTKLKEGSGTSNAIFQAAGRNKLNNECRKARKKYGKLLVGSAIPTLAGNLNADFIIHAICPKWVDGKHDEYNLLAATYYSVLRLADLLGCETVALPVLSSGHNGYDQKLAFEIAKASIEEYSAENKLKTAYLIVYDMSMMNIIKKLNIEVMENIDDSYVIGQDEHYKSFIEEVELYGQKLSQTLLHDAANLIDDFLSDPEKRKQLLIHGAKIVLEVLSHSEDKNPN